MPSHKKQAIGLVTYHYIDIELTPSTENHKSTRIKEAQEAQEA
jgi:hypothetical protein